MRLPDWIRTRGTPHGVQYSARCPWCEYESPWCDWREARLYGMRHYKDNHRDPDLADDP